MSTTLQDQAGRLQGQLNDNGASLPGDFTYQDSVNAASTRLARDGQDWNHMDLTSGLNPVSGIRELYDGSYTITDRTAGTYAPVSRTSHEYTPTSFSGSTFGGIQTRDPGGAYTVTGPAAGRDPGNLSVRGELGASPGVGSVGVVGDIGGGGDFSLGNLPSVRRNTGTMTDNTGVMRGQQSLATQGQDLVRSKMGTLNDPMPTVSDATRQRTEDALYQRMQSRMDPEYQQAEQAMRSDLMNRGLVEGSEAWNTQIDAFNRRRNDAYGGARLDAIQHGGTEQSRLYGDQLKGRDQLLQELMGVGNLSGGINSSLTGLMGAETGQFNARTGLQQADTAQRHGEGNMQTNAAAASARASTDAFTARNNAEQGAFTANSDATIGMRNSDISAFSAMNDAERGAYTAQATARQNARNSDLDAWEMEQGARAAQFRDNTSRYDTMAGRELDSWKMGEDARRAGFTANDNAQNQAYTASTTRNNLMGRLGLDEWSAQQGVNQDTFDGNMEARRDLMNALTSRQNADTATWEAEQGVTGTQYAMENAARMGENQNLSNYQNTLQGLAESDFNLRGADRAGSIQERTNLINVLNALRTGSQVAMPNFQQATGPGVDAAPVAQSTYNSFNGAMNQYNSAVGSNNQTMGTLGQLGAAAMIATSMF